MGSLVFGPNMPPEGQIRKSAPVRAKAADERRFRPVGADHHPDSAERRREHRRFGPGRVADGLVFQFLPMSRAAETS